MELKIEAGDNTEVPTAATKSPEQVTILRFADLQPGAIRCDDICGEQVVDGHSVLPAEPAEATAEGQTGHARPRIDAQRCGEAVRLRGGVQAVRFARKHSMLVSIRGGGHNIAGNAVCDDGLMIDLSLMKSVHVDHQSI